MNPVRVVAVEDERLVARDLKLRLNELGYDVPALAASAEEAMQVVRDFHPDVVLMDIRLQGGTDGIEAARIVRERFDVPVIFVTAHADTETLKRASVTEAFGYILKPFDDRELRAAIEMALYKHASENLLRATQERLVRAQRIAQLGNWEQDLKTGEFYVSREACRILGIEGGESASFTEDRLLSMVHPEDQPAVREAFRNSASLAKPLRVDHRVISCDEGERFVRQCGESVVDAVGNGVRLLGTVQDITEYKNLEEKLRRSQRIEAIGQLAGGVAHDFNNLLVVIKGYCDMILSDLQPDDPLYGRVQEILNAGERAAALTRQLLAFARRQVIRPQVLNLNDLIAGLEKMLRRLVVENIEFRTALAPGIWHVRADPGQIEQLVVNIVVNAKDAMPKGGLLTLSTSNVELDTAQLSRLSDLEPGRHVSLSIADTGSGIAPQVKGHVFEPFFTTKAPGEGTGLGLSTVYGIVKQHKGDISVESELGRGSVFTVYLPAVEQGSESAATQKSVPRARGGNETILLVEDDDGVRHLATRMLEQLGYTVLAASDGAEALDISARRGTPVRVLLTDVVMPQMSGWDLAERMMKVWPELKVVFMSGYTGREMSQHGVSESNMRFLQKPFSADELGRIIREALDVRGGQPD